MSTSTEEIIQQAIADAKAGNKLAARDILSQVVKEDGQNARAWYLLSQVVDTQEQAINCLEVVLKIQPDNQQAQERLEKLKSFNNYPDIYKDQVSQQPPQSQYSPSKQTQGQLNQQDLVRALAATRSFYGPAMLTLILYFIGFGIGGLIANIIYLNAAYNAQNLSGVSPEGKGCLWALLITNFILFPVVCVFMLFFTGFIWGLLGLAGSP